MEFRKTGVSMGKRLVPVVLILGWLIPGAAMALGLGPITMRSALNQPLLAEIDIHSVQPGDLDNLAVRLASEEDFNHIKLTDDVDEVIDAMVKHRSWKLSQIAKARDVSQ